MFAHTWTTHIILGNFTLPGFRNCVKALAPSVKGRGNMEIIKDFLILKFHLSLIKIQMIVTQVVNATLMSAALIISISFRTDLTLFPYFCK